MEILYHALCLHGVRGHAALGHKILEYELGLWYSTVFVNCLMYEPLCPYIPFFMCIQDPRAETGIPTICDHRRHESLALCNQDRIQAHDGFSCSWECVQANSSYDPVLAQLSPQATLFCRSKGHPECSELPTVTDLRFYAPVIGQIAIQGDFLCAFPFRMQQVIVHGKWPKISNSWLRHK